MLQENEYLFHIIFKRCYDNVLILQKLLIVFNSTLFISKNYKINNAHKMIFSDKVCLVVKKLIKNWTQRVIK